VVTLALVPTDVAGFQADVGAPAQADWGMAAAVTRPAARAALRVVIDPGHGGIDPGAEHGGAREADVMLALGLEVADALRRAGIDTILTRDSDVFVPLDRRVTIARQLEADLMISLHADALEGDQASGASVYTLSQTGVDGAAQRMAERHERGDLLAGLDLAQQDDRVATVLMELARQDTGPQADRFADTLVTALRGAGAQVNTRPRRSGRLAVLSAADFASVLLEVGFLTNASDRDRLRTPDGRAPFVTGIVRAVQQWSVDEAARAPLVRK
jgi:N-acetylmuramoyl-L-alanine amidase